jgi:tetratricopeptide (TPR) repeat protein
MNRLEQLHRFLEEDPNDPFNTYALALEYQKTDTTKALTLFTALINTHPDYVPTYYHLGKLYADLHQKEDALNTFKAGIEKAKQVNDAKALRELSAAKMETEFEM